MTSPSRKCLCGHSHVYHMGADRRGHCTGVQIVSPAQWPEGLPRRKPENFTTISAERWQALMNHYAQRQNWTRLEKAMGRGFVRFDCTCPMYHEVEIGQVNIILPDEAKKQEPSRDTKLIVPGK